LVCPFYKGQFASKQHPVPRLAACMKIF